MSPQPVSNHVRPTSELLDRLHAAKRTLHETHARLPLSAKVGMVLQLQRIVLPLLARQRPLRYWERPWEIEP